MKVYILHECIDSSDFYAEDNVIMVTKDRVKAIDKWYSCSMKARITYSL